MGKIKGDCFLGSLRSLGLILRSVLGQNFYFVHEQTSGLWLFATVRRFDQTTLMNRLCSFTRKVQRSILLVRNSPSSAAHVAVGVAEQGPAQISSTPGEPSPKSSILNSPSVSAEFGHIPRYLDVLAERFPQQYS